jgi:hypothetical protein
MTDLNAPATRRHRREPIDQIRPLPADRRDAPRVNPAGGFRAPVN